MFYKEPERSIEAFDGYDVIVAGSGPAGIAAALMAGRSGCRVLLIEACGSPGGISTSGLMSHFTGTVDSRLYDELLKRASEKYYAFNNAPLDIPDPQMTSLINIDPEMLKLTYIEMLEEAGVEMLFYTFVCGVVMDGKTVKGVITESKSGRRAYLGKAVIDCTGDGDVAAMAGAEYFLGRESDHKMQPATMMFKVGGVDPEKAVYPPSFETTIETEKGELQALAKEKLPHPAGHVLLYRSTIPGIVTCNMTNCIDIDGTKAEDLTRAEIVCRKQMVPIVKFLREYVPGYENCYIISAASLMGIRETRHFYGVSTITEEDILAARLFEDWVVRGAHFNFDVHNLTGASLDETGVQKHFKQQKGYSIPYGCLVPRDIDGLLLSGRNISGTHMAHSNFRVMPICLAMGEACGAAAAIAVTRDIPLRDVPAGDIQQKLI
ncbi:MAG: FAD-dependent oxidoreductase [Oscillospiraceae bacterium]|nr:FAD-dependent oxidoreductase [Oscillospiraceae bacterium]